MSIDITAEVVVPRPRDQVAAFMTDPANDREWIGGLRDVRLLGPEPLAAGSRRTRTVAHACATACVAGRRDRPGLLSPPTACMVRRNVQRDLDTLRRRLDG